MTSQPTSMHVTLRATVFAAAIMSFCYLLAHPAFAAPAHASHEDRTNAPSRALTVLLQESVPLALVGKDGKPYGVGVDFVALLDSQQGVGLQALPVKRQAFLQAIGNERFDLTLLYASSERDERLINLGVVRDVHLVELTLEATSAGQPLGYLRSLAPPPPITQSSKTLGFDNERTAMDALVSGRITRLVLPQKAALILHEQLTPAARARVVTAPAGSWPIVLYARPDALTESEARALSDVVDRSRISRVFDRYLERFYREIASEAG